MRAFAWFLAAILGTLLLAAVLAYPLYLVVHPLAPDWPFHKIAGRFWQFSMLAGVALCVWKLRLAGRADFGYDLSWPDFRRQWARALAIGIVTMLPMTIAMLVLDIRVPRPGLDAALFAEVLLSGLATGLAIGLVEETFFRGLMFTAVRRESGIRAAVLLTALVYASIHFLARMKIPHASVGPGSGLALLAGTLRAFAHPLTIIDAFLTLFLVGVLLALVRQWTGAIAASIGLHMGWVWMIKLTVGVTEGRPDGPLYALVSRFDGFTGWMVGAWCAAILAVAWSRRDWFASWRLAAPPQQAAHRAGAAFSADGSRPATRRNRTS